MNSLEITPIDLELIQEAKHIISERYKFNHHLVGAAI
jgi:hypothetical protein